MAEIQSHNAELWAITIDPAEKLETMKEELGLEIPLLLDPGSATIRGYGVLNEDHGEIPHPATLVIDQEGTVRLVEINTNYRERPPTERVLEVLGEIPPVSPL